MKLATIETISALRPHNNADRLEIATVLGWQTVVKKGEFKEGDRVVLVVIDTILPFAPWSEFLADKGQPEKPIRLKTVKLRGEYSQGLVLPLSVLPEHVRDWQVGADVGGELGVKKYEKETPAVLSGEAKGAFPTHYAPRTDEDNALSNPDIVYMVLQSYPILYVTLKLDGSSCTVVVEDGKILDVCSRNLSLLDDGKNGFWRAVKRLDLSGVKGRWIVQGELMGPGVQGNQLELKEPTLYVFQVKHPSGVWCGRDVLERFCESIKAEVVPLLEKVHVSFWDLSAFQAKADAVRLPNGKPAEGIVVRPGAAVAFGNGRPASFKIINRNYADT